MDISIDKSETDGYQPGSFLAISLFVRDFTRRLIGFFGLTEADKLKVAIQVSGEGPDE